ncbi:MAG: glutamate racemase [Defluviitaleaceae bacterium]|nr:glutamate racemase [Defluviitaleaceae bacterium]
MRIGIMDSGIGGLTVLKECLTRLPEHEYLYYADSNNAPYGVKSQQEVYALTAAAVAFLVEKEVDMIVLACNTATSAAVKQLRQQYQIPIVGMEPAIKPALALSRGKRVLVTATALTLDQPKFKALIGQLDRHGQVDFLPLTELVAFAENGDFDFNTILTYLKEKLVHLDLTLYGSVVLGCTHFPLFKACFEAIFPKGTAIVDGAVGTTNRIKAFANFTSPTPKTTFFLSGEPLLEGPLFNSIQTILTKVDAWEQKEQ